MAEVFISYSMKYSKLGRLTLQADFGNYLTVISPTRDGQPADEPIGERPG